MRQHVRVLGDDLLKVHHGTKTEEGFRLNIRVGVQYIEAWLRGRGAVPIYNLMEDAATAEISRAQIWQWIRYEAELEGGIVATPKFFERALVEEMERVKEEVGVKNYVKGRFPEAIAEYRKNISLNGETPRLLCHLGYAYAMSGKRDETLATLNKLKTTKDYVSPYDLAKLYVGLGDKEAALESLERAYRDLSSRPFRGRLSRPARRWRASRPVFSRCSESRRSSSRDDAGLHPLRGHPGDALLPEDPQREPDGVDEGHAEPPALQPVTECSLPGLQARILVQQLRRRNRQFRFVI